MPLAEDAVKYFVPEATVSDKIRALAAAGYSRAEIARILGKRYQHVRNVLEGDKLKAPAQPQASDRRGMVRSAGEGLRVGDFVRLPIGPEGAVRLPPDLLEALNLRAGGVLLGELEGDVLTVMSPKESLRRAKANIPAWRPGEPMWSEELIAERRREQAAEDKADG